MTTFLLARHGATAHTAQRRFSGCTGSDPALSPAGERQAAALAAALAATGRVDAVVTSPVRRARQTAEAVAAALGMTPAVDDDLREIDFGAWEGRTLPEVEAGWPADLAAWRSSPRVAPPGGEPVDRVGERVRRVRERLAGAHPTGTVLLVSHLYPVRLSVLDALGAPYGSVHRMVLAPTAVSEIRADALLRYNDASHLGAAGLDGGH